MRAKHLVIAGLACSVIGVMGCRVSTDKQDGKENVSVTTPFGGVKVKANNDAPVEGLGLPVYPGAEMVKKKDKDNASADVNLSFGSFQFRVKAASYHTPDDVDKVTEFYRNALKRYGTVIACRHDQPVGTPTRTEEGLTCSDNNKHVKAKTDDSDDELELRAGSKQHQHIVGVKPEDNGTKIGLVALDLPTSFTGDSDPEARQ